MKRGGPLKRGAPLRRKARMKRSNPERKAKRRALAFAECARMCTLLPCCVPSCWRQPPSEPCHLRSRGAGGLDWANCFPACRRHHDESHRIGVRSFELRHQVHLEVVCGYVAELVRGHTCESTPGRSGRACYVCGQRIEEPRCP